MVTFLYQAKEMFHTNTRQDQEFYSDMHLYGLITSPGDSFNTTNSCYFCAASKDTPAKKHFTLKRKQFYLVISK